jgi:CDGSH-type Zn-finger protein
MTDNIPTIAKKSPYAVEVEEGKRYYWCACGKSQTQPFCDGSHQGTGFTPVEYKAEQTGTVYFCGCKHSAKGALCDGSHQKL